MNKPCTFCGSKMHRIVLSTAMGDSLFCRQCGGIENHSNDRYIYTSSYYSDNYDQIETQQIARFTRILQDIEPLVKKYRILDVGCGTGLLLRAAYTLGYRNSVGIDSSVDAVEIARKKLADTDVSIQLNLNPVVGQFGVISFMDSIAHIDNLEKTFSSLISDNLMIGGLLMVKTPYYSGFYAYYGIILGRLLGIIGKSGFISSQIFYMPARFSLFTEKALDAFIKKYGFSRLYISVEPEYVKVRPKIVGLKNRITYFFLRVIPEIIRSGDRSMVFIARKN